MRLFQIVNSGSAFLVLFLYEGGGAFVIGFFGCGSSRGLLSLLLLLLLLSLSRDRLNLMDLLQVNLEVVGALKHLSALWARVGDEAALVLVPHVTEKRALEVEAAVARFTAKFVSISRLHHREHVVCICEPLQTAAARRCGSRRCGRCGFCPTRRNRPRMTWLMRRRSNCYCGDATIVEWGGGRGVPVVGDGRRG